MRKFLNFFLLVIFVTTAFGVGAQTFREEYEQNIRDKEWPNTDFSKALISLDELDHGGTPKDGIPAIDFPKFVPASLVRNISPKEPVISIEIDGEARAYPFRFLMYHEIVNDLIKGKPITVTYCPLCNSAMVFSRQVGSKTLTFGVTGWLRNSDLVMYDRQTESWWQQFTGKAIIGDMAGETLKRLPARIESFEKFKKRNPFGDVLFPENPGTRDYGSTPYAGYDSQPYPYFRAGPLPDNIPAMARVVTVGNQAWALSLVRQKGRIETTDGLIITWEEGQTSALDTRIISGGWDVGNVLVQRITGTGLILVPYSVDFAFAFHAFYPESKIIVE